MAKMVRATSTTQWFHHQHRVRADRPPGYACEDRRVTVDADGSVLLTSADVQPLLATAVEHAGGALVSWRLQHVDSQPGWSTTATYAATIDWPTGRRGELLGASARVGGRRGNDDRAVVFGDGDREVAVWLYPDDPDLPGLRRVASVTELCALLAEHKVVQAPPPPESVTLEMISYRPRRRAVVKVTIPGSAGPQAYFVKVLREAAVAPTLERHQLLLAAGFPAPVVAAITPDCCLVLPRVAGRPLARALFDESMPCSAENLVGVLDSLPPGVTGLRRRPPWSDAVTSYAEMVTSALPTAAPQLSWLVTQITAGLAGIAPGSEPTHGDFHEGQVFVSGGMITGVVDIDTVGPGRRADDLACLLAHLSTVQRMSAEQAIGLNRLLSLWTPVFETRVDPIELRLRAAAVIISLATGPYRAQQPQWAAETATMLNAAEALARSAAR
jgi:Phosphotransferase enzyme family